MSVSLIDAWLTFPRVTRPALPSAPALISASELTSLRAAWSWQARVAACFVAACFGAVAAGLLIAQGRPIVACATAAAVVPVQTLIIFARGWAECLFDYRLQRVTGGPGVMAALRAAVAACAGKVWRGLMGGSQLFNGHSTTTEGGAGYAELVVCLDDDQTPQHRANKVHPGNPVWQKQAAAIAILWPRWLPPLEKGTLSLTGMAIVVTLVPAIIRFQENQPTNGTIHVPVGMNEVFNEVAKPPSNKPELPGPIEPVLIAENPGDTTEPRTSPEPSEISSTRKPGLTGPITVPADPAKAAETITTVTTETVPNALQVRRSLEDLRMRTEDALIKARNVRESDASSAEDAIERAREQLDTAATAFKDKAKSAQDDLNRIIHDGLIPEELRDSAKDLSDSIGDIANSIGEDGNIDDLDRFLSELASLLEDLSGVLNELGEFLKLAGDFMDSVLGAESGLGRGLRAAGRELQQAAEAGHATARQIRGFRDELASQLQRAGTLVTTNLPPGGGMPQDRIPPRAGTDSELPPGPTSRERRRVPGDLGDETRVDAPDGGANAPSKLPPSGG